MTQTTQYSCYVFLLFVALPQCFGVKGVRFPADSTLLSPAPSHSVSFWLMYKIGHFTPLTCRDKMASPPFEVSICRTKREGKVRCGDLPKEGLLHLHKCRLTPLHPLDQIWFTLPGMNLW